jgi:hypothetical protein
LLLSSPREASSPEAGSFNIGTGCATTIGSALEYLADCRGGRALLRLGPIEPPAGEPPRLVADMAKVRAGVGRSAPTSIEAGLTQVLGPQR